MITIGVIGGVASGKSSAARMLADYGAGVLDADQTGNNLLNEANITTAIVDQWGDEVLAADGSVDRPVLARHVFGDSEEARIARQFLEKLVHPRIRQRLLQQARQMREKGVDVCVLDAPLLLEAGWKPDCDLLLMIDCPREVRQRRAIERGWTSEQFQQREAAQLSVEDKRAAADVTIVNEGRLEDLRQRLDTFWRQHVTPRLEVS